MTACSRFYILLIQQKVAKATWRLKICFTCQIFALDSAVVKTQKKFAYMPFQNTFLSSSNLNNGHSPHLCTGLEEGTQGSLFENLTLCGF